MLKLLQNTSPINLLFFYCLIMTPLLYALCRLSAGMPKKKETKRKNRGPKR